MAKAFLGPDVRGIADLERRHVRFCIVKSFGLKAYRAEVERRKFHDPRATYLAIRRYYEARWKGACAETPA